MAETSRFELGIIKIASEQKYLDLGNLVENLVFYCKQS